MSTKIVEYKMLKHDDYGYMLLEGELFTGTAVDYSPNGQITSEIGFIEGLQDGWRRLWYSDGGRKEETFVEKGCVVGVSRKWYTNGQLKMEEEIEHGITIRHQEWDENGNLLKVVEINEKNPLYATLMLMRKNNEASS